MPTSSIHFFLNNELIELSAFSPTLTLLQYLREHKRLTGSKEGCAEGDCGACTVVIAELTLNHQAQFKAVNACILPIALLNGKQIITIEALAESPATSDAKLHPVQQAFVQHHASQCGFCTPGFVMSSYALYLNSTRAPDLTPDAMEQQLRQTYAGNLCRCTGYGSILSAGKAILTLDNSSTKSNERDHWLQHLQHLAKHLSTQPSPSLAQPSADSPTLYAPQSEQALVNLLDQHPEATLIAGATDIGVWITKKQFSAPCFISLTQIPSLQIAHWQDDRLIIGAAATYQQAIPLLLAQWPELKTYLSRHSSEQIRHMATVVGNIANGSPIADMPPVLIALKAQVILHSIQGERTLALEDYFIEYGQQARHTNEYIKAIVIPKNAPTLQLKVYKISKRQQQDIATLNAAFALELEQQTVKSVRIVYGGLAGTPKRTTQTEALLQNQPWQEAIIQQACEQLAHEFSPLDDLRASKNYRLLVAQNLLRKFFLHTQNHTQASSVHDLPIEILFSRSNDE